MQPKSLPSLIANRYHVERLLGEGGMGFVYKADDSLLKITVAIKKLHHYNTHDSIVRFQNEAVALGKLSHNNIARILDFARDGDTLYMVMEYLDGISLADAIKSERLLVVDALQIFVEISHAMMHAHKHGVLHRDLKPSNIILVDGADAQRIPKVVDFGIAKMQSRDQQLTATGVGIGSPFYMSPEQTSSGAVDERSDIYSFGCLMFESLTGDVPLSGDNYLETVQKQIHEQPPRLDEIPDAPQFPEGLVALVDKCLAKNPDHRFQRFSEVNEQLLNILDEETNVRVVEEVIGSEPANVPRKPAVPTWLIACVTLLIFALVVLIWLGVAELQKPAKQQADPRLFAKERIESEFPLTKTKKLKSKLNSDLRFSPDLQGLFWSPPEDADFKKLKGNRTLTDVTIEESDIDGTGFVYLKNAPLKVLYVNNCQVTDEGMRTICELQSLRSLNLNELFNITDNGLVNLPNLKELEQFTISKCGRVTDDGLNVLSKLKNLQSICLDNSDLTDKCLPYLKNHKLTSAMLLANNMTPDGMADFVTQHRDLVAIGLNGQDLNDRLVDSVSRSAIQSVTLKDVIISDKQLEMLVSSKAITHLALDGSGMEATGFEVLPRSKSLTRLRIFNMTNTKVSIVDSLTKLHLKYFRIERSNISDSQLLRFAKMKTLEEVDIYRSTQLTEAGVSKFQEELHRKQKTKAKVTFLSEAEAQSRK